MGSEDELKVKPGQNYSIGIGLKADLTMAL